MVGGVVHDYMVGGVVHDYMVGGVVHDYMVEEPIIFYKCTRRGTNQDQREPYFYNDNLNDPCIVVAHEVRF